MLFNTRLLHSVFPYLLVRRLSVSTDIVLRLIIADLLEVLTISYPGRLFPPPPLPLFSRVPFSPAISAEGLAKIKPATLSGLSHANLNNTLAPAPIPSPTNHSKPNLIATWSSWVACASRENSFALRVELERQGLRVWKAHQRSVLWCDFRPLYARIAIVA